MQQTLEIGYAYCVVPQHAAELFLAVAERLGFKLNRTGLFTENAAGIDAVGVECITTKVLTQLVLTGDIEQLQHFLHWWDTRLGSNHTGIITRKPIE